MKTKNRILVWDLPTRYFHWLLMLGIFSSAIFAFFFDDDSSYFTYHAVFGLFVFFIVILRILYGFIGSTYSRFNSFLFQPKELFNYLKSAFLFRDTPYIGHNPGAAYAIIAMLIIIIGLGVTGILLALGNESVEELHEILAYSMIGVVSVHILGVFFHIYRHRENIIASMIHGKKMTVTEAGINSSRPGTLILFIILLILFSFHLLSNFNAANKTINAKFLGVELKVGDSENEKDNNSKFDHDEDED